MIDLNKLADRHERLRHKYEKTFGAQSADAGVVFVADPDYIRTFNGQITWATLLNLTARLYKGIRHIRIVIDADVVRVPHVCFLNDIPNVQQASLHLLEELNAAAFTIGEGRPRDNVQQWIWVHVGAASPDLPPGIAVAGRGWLALVNDDSWKLARSDHNPIGAMVAACLGTAEIYKALYPLREEKGPTRIALSAFDFSDSVESNPALPENVDLPSTYIAGTGAVGMAVLFVLNSIPAIRSGDGLHVVDDDTIDDTNINRCVLTILKDIGSAKLDVLMSRLDIKRLGVVPHQAKWQSFVQEPEHSDPKKFERVISCVDKYVAREAVQYDRLPKVLLSAGTGDFLLTVSRHILDDGLSCGLCYQAKDVEPDCANASEAAQQAFVGPADPSISFVSVLAGVLLAAEFIKETIPALHTGRIHNTVRVATLRGSAKKLARPKDPRCNCSSRYVAIGYRATWEASQELSSKT